MLRVQTLSLKKTIIHRLDNQNYPNGKELSDFELELNDELKEVIQTHIKNGFEDSRIRYAKFREIDTNSVAHQIQNYQDSQFVNTSKKLANLLYQSMSSKAISPADIIIGKILCNDEEYIILLKLDYKKHYLSEVIPKDGGKYISIKSMEKGWPELGTRLQKAAFIKINPGDDFDLIILDRQQRKKSSGDEDTISKFFSDDFLYVDLLDDENTNTSSFIKGVRAFTEKSEYLEISQAKAIYENAINLVVNSSKINIREFAESHFPEENEEHQAIVEEMIDIFNKNGVKRGEFNKSEKFATYFSKKRKIVLSGMKIDIDPAIYEDKDKFEYEIRRNSAGESIADITIHGLKIENWE